MYKVNDKVKGVELGDYVYVVMEVYENYRGFGKHSYRCRTMGGNYTKTLNHDSLVRWP